MEKRGLKETCKIFDIDKELNKIKNIINILNIQKKNISKIISIFNTIKNKYSNIGIYFKNRYTLTVRLAVLVFRPFDVAFHIGCILTPSPFNDFTTQSFQ